MNITTYRQQIKMANFEELNQLRIQVTYDEDLTDDQTNELLASINKNRATFNDHPVPHVSTKKLTYFYRQEGAITTDWVPFQLEPQYAKAWNEFYIKRNGQVTAKEHKEFIEHLRKELEPC